MNKKIHNKISIKRTHNNTSMLHKRINELSNKIKTEDNRLRNIFMEMAEIEYSDGIKKKKLSSKEKSKLEVLNKEYMNLDELIDTYKKELRAISDELSSLSKLKTIKTRRSSLREYYEENKLVTGFVRGNFDVKTLNAINDGKPVTIQKLTNLAELLETSPLTFIDRDNLSYFLNNYPNYIFSNDKLYLDNTQIYHEGRSTTRIPIKELSLGTELNKEFAIMRGHTASMYGAKTTIRWVLDGISDEYSWPLDDLKEDLLKIEEVIKKECLTDNKFNKRVSSEKLFKRVSSADTLSSYSLDSQIDKLKSNKVRKASYELIKDFYNKHSLLLYYGNYNYWSHTILDKEPEEIKEGDFEEFKLEKILILYLSNNFTQFPEEASPKYNRISYINVQSGYEPIKQLLFTNITLPKEIFINGIPLKIPEWMKDYYKESIKRKDRKMIKEK